MDTYLQTRSRVETYFDRTAAQAWARLTSDAPVGRIRASVRAGRDRMRATLLSWLPEDLAGLRLLDAGCGTGALAVEAARRGARVTAIDLSPTLVALARERAPAVAADGGGAVDFRSGDMLDAALGHFDYVVAMDSLIHYAPADAVRAVAALAQRTRLALLFTFAPSSPALAAMHAVGRLFPRGDRSPSIVPVAEAALRRRLGAEAALHGWAVSRTERVACGFYTSQAMRIARTD
jgi:magnesium-protoporphyrin O-methyltransferase